MAYAMSVDFPGAAPVGAADLLRAATAAVGGAGARLAIAAAGLFVPDDHQLDEYQRSTMRLLLNRLVAAIEGELRATLSDPRLPAPAIAALGSARIAIAMPLLAETRLLDDPELIAILLARSDEQRIFAAARAQRGAEGLPQRAVEALLSDPDPLLGEAAMAVLVAESRRFDALDAAALARTDLGAELQVRLVWRIAAALRHWLVRWQKMPAADADAALGAAVAAALARHDEGETLESAALQLALALAARSRLTDATLTAAISEGRLTLFLACFSARAGLDLADARALILAPGIRQRLVALRAIGLARSDAAVIVMALNAGQRPDSEIADDLAGYESLDPALAREAIRPWSLDPVYRDALAALAAGEGAPQ